MAQKRVCRAESSLPISAIYADDDDVAPLPKRQKIAVGDRVTLTLDPLEGVVTKTGSGWITVKFEFGGVDNFRHDELRLL